jgi:cyclic pyranopterin phosphate synthase
MVEFTHIKNERAHMVDVSGKDDVTREAVAEGRIYLRPETLEAIREGSVLKGNVLATARVAAIQAVKATPTMIPMCHPLALGGVEVEFDEGEGFIEARVRVISYGKTGVEMEALTGVSVGLLTVWDMVKSAEKDAGGQYPTTRIEGIRVLEKRKGRSLD